MDSFPHHVSESMLAAVPLFENLSPAERHHLAATSELHAWPDNGIILTKGEAATGMYVVLQGVAKVFNVSPDGHESVLHLIRRGNTLGEAAMFQQNTFPATACAVGEVRALFIKAEVVRSMIMENPDLALRMLAALSARLRMFSHKLSEQGQGGASRRLAAWLVHRLKLEYGTRPWPENPMVKTGVPREVLANLLGVARETLSRQLSNLESQGIIRRQGRDLVVLNASALQAQAADKKSTP